MKSKLTALAIMLFMAIGNSVAGSVAGTGGSTEVTQLANNAQLVMSYGEQAQQTATQFNQYQAMLRNLQRMTPSSSLAASAQKLWADQNMNTAFKSLYQVVVGGQRIAYAGRSMDTQLQVLNPGYGKYLNNNGFDLQNAYRNWSDTTRSSTFSALQLTTAHAEDMQSEADVMSELSNMSNSVDGQVQATQAGNQISLAMVSQMQKLRQLQMAQMQAQNFSTINTQARQDASDEALMQAMKGQCTRVRTPDEIKRGVACK